MLNDQQKKIRKLMLDHDVMGSEIARAQEVSGALVSKVIKGERHNPGVKEDIASRVGKSVEELFKMDVSRR